MIIEPEEVSRFWKFKNPFYKNHMIYCEECQGRRKWAYDPDPRNGIFQCTDCHTIISIEHA